MKKLHHLFGLCLALALLCTLAACVPSTAHAQERFLSLNATGGIDDTRFLTATGIDSATPAAVVPTAIGAQSGTVYTVPFGTPVPIGYVNGNPPPLSANTTTQPVPLAFHPTSVVVETTAATGVTTGPTIAIPALGSATFAVANSTATGSIQTYPLPTSTVLVSGTVLNYTTTGGAGGALALKIYVRGFYR